jgi:hypothetical protein
MHLELSECLHHGRVAKGARKVSQSVEFDNKSARCKTHEVVKQSSDGAERGA